MSKFHECQAHVQATALLYAKNILFYHEIVTVCHSDIRWCSGINWLSQIDIVAYVAIDQLGAVGVLCQSEPITANECTQGASTVL